MLDFYRTPAGRQFFDRTLPRIAEALESLVVVVTALPKVGDLHDLRGKRPLTQGAVDVLNEADERCEELELRAEALEKRNRLLEIAVKRLSTKLYDGTALEAYRERLREGGVEPLPTLLERHLDPEDPFEFTPEGRHPDDHFEFGPPEKPRSETHPSMAEAEAAEEVETDREIDGDRREAGVSHLYPDGLPSEPRCPCEEAGEVRADCDVHGEDGPYWEKEKP